MAITPSPTRTWARHTIISQTSLANSQIIITTAKEDYARPESGRARSRYESVRRHFLTAAAFSFALNVLHLTRRST